MNFNEYQDGALDTAIYPGKFTDMGLAYVALGLTGEAGEFAEKVKKKLRDDKFDFEKAAKELGDVLWYVANAASEIGYDLQTIAELNLDKLQSRKERGVLQGNGDVR